MNLLNHLMHGFLRVSCLLFFPFAIFAQAASMPNIVPNPSFEVLSSTPIGWFYKGAHFTKVMKYWSSPTIASPDVFCPKVRVPATWTEKGFGEQKAQQGDNMVGFTVFGCENGKPHCREYIQCQLIEPLVVGQDYSIKYHVSHLPRSISINRIDVAFSTEMIATSTDQLLPIPATWFPEKIIEAPKKWVELEGRFVASSPSEFILFGNFAPDSITLIKATHQDPLPFGYYYLDNVELKKIPPILPIPIYEDDLTKIPLEIGKIIELKNVFFEFDKWELHPRSSIELNKLMTILQSRPEMTITVSGHTDNKGDEAYNQLLSQKRAQAVVDYLVQRGIDIQRLEVEGHGSSIPLSDNLTERGRQKNRRVEFRVRHL